MDQLLVMLQNYIDGVKIKIENKKLNNNAVNDTHSKSNCERTVSKDHDLEQNQTLLMNNALLIEKELVQTFESPAVQYRNLEDEMADKNECQSTRDSSSVHEQPKASSEHDELKQFSPSPLLKEMNTFAVNQAKAAVENPIEDTALQFIKKDFVSQMVINGLFVPLVYYNVNTSNTHTGEPTLLIMQINNFMNRVGWLEVNQENLPNIATVWIRDKQTNAIHRTLYEWARSYVHDINKQSITVFLTEIDACNIALSTFVSNFDITAKDLAYFYIAAPFKYREHDHDELRNAFNSVYHFGKYTPFSEYEAKLNRQIMVAEIQRIKSELQITRLKDHIHTLNTALIYSVMNEGEMLAEVGEIMKNSNGTMDSHEVFALACKRICAKAQTTPINPILKQTVAANNNARAQRTENATVTPPIDRKRHQQRLPDNDPPHGPVKKKRTYVRRPKLIKS